jgi:putative Holliday junction resolvase
MTAGVVLGFDYGERRIGIATGQTITRSATPLITLNAINHQPDWAGIQQLIEEWKPDVLVVGIPSHLDGTASELTARAERFSRQLHGRFNLPVHCVNENLTSFEAEHYLQQNKKIGQHNKQEIDRMAAAIIVQTWLNQLP